MILIKLFTLSTLDKNYILFNYLKLLNTLTFLKENINMLNLEQLMTKKENLLKQGMGVQKNY